MIDFTEDVFTLVIDDANIEENVAITKRFIDAMGFKVLFERELLNISKKIEQKQKKDSNKENVLSIESNNNSTTKQKNIQVVTPKIAEDSFDITEQQNLGLNAGTFGNTSPREPIFAEVESRKTARNLVMPPSTKTS